MMHFVQKTDLQYVSLMICHLLETQIQLPHFLTIKAVASGSFPIPTTSAEPRQHQEFCQQSTHNHGN